MTFAVLQGPIRAVSLETGVVEDLTAQGTARMLVHVKLNAMNGQQV